MRVNWNVFLLFRVSLERQIEIRKIQCFTPRHELEDILDDGLTSRQDMTPSAIGEFLIRISTGKFGAGQCPILLPQDVDVTDFGDLSEADDSVLLHLMLEPKENYVRATQYDDERITTRIQNVFQETEEIDVPEFMRIINMINVSICIRLSDIKLVESPPMKLKAVPTSITKVNVEMNTINVAADGTCTVRDRSFRDESKTKRTRHEADYDDLKPVVTIAMEKRKVMCM